jgi:hypothetical protein
VLNTTTTHTFNTAILKLDTEEMSFHAWLFPWWLDQYYKGMDCHTSGSGHQFTVVPAAHVLSTYLNQFLTLTTLDHHSVLCCNRLTNSVSKTENLICSRSMSKARHACSISMFYLTSSIFFMSSSILMFFSCSLLLFLPISDSLFVTFSLWRFPFSWNSMLCKYHRQTV